MNKYKVKVLETADKQVWNLFVDHSPWGDILQLWEWGELKRLEGWRPMRVAVIEEGKIRLVAQILLKPVPLLGNYAYIPHGPVIHSTENLSQVFKAFIDYLTHYSKTYDFVSLEMDPKLGKFIQDEKHLEIPDNLKFYTDSEYYKALEQLGVFITGRNTQPVYKLMYDLAQNDDEILAHCNKSTRYNIKQATKQGVTINEYLPDDSNIRAKLDEFYELLKETQERAKGYPMHDKNYFYTLFELFKGTEHVVLTEAVVDGDVVAMNISQRTKGWSSSFYAGSNRLHPKSKASYLLRWHSIQSAKNQGSKTYDFWGIIPNSKEHQGYSSHKLGYGGYRIDTYGLLAVPLNPLKYSLWTNAIWLRTKGVSEARRFVWNFRKETLPLIKQKLTNLVSQNKADNKSQPENTANNLDLDLATKNLKTNENHKTKTPLPTINITLPTETSSQQQNQEKTGADSKVQNHLPKPRPRLALENQIQNTPKTNIPEFKETEFEPLKDDKTAAKKDLQESTSSNHLPHKHNKTNSAGRGEKKSNHKKSKSRSKVIKNFKKKNKTRSKIS